ncbi:hypothetical protein IFM89_029288 [Coptis chinensis]|uniref:Transmembrane protein n=1 Tax=Coptis chinensis TaxID=261450 RepID=A0A835HY30_9MAGN|nr:hypothetical protein IFM89_029288 [Coptis chinensis]
MLDKSTSTQPTGLKTNVLWGWCFIVFGCMSFLGFIYAAVLSKLLPPSDNPVLSAIQKDSWKVGFEGGELELVYSLKVHRLSLVMSLVVEYGVGDGRDDMFSSRYYCILVPITLPVLVVAVYFHWLSMKLFKHA